MGEGQGSGGEGEEWGRERSGGGRGVGEGEEWGRERGRRGSHLLVDIDLPSLKSTWSHGRLTIWRRSLGCCQGHPFAI